MVDVNLSKKFLNKYLTYASSKHIVFLIYFMFHSSETMNFLISHIKSSFELSDIEVIEMLNFWKKEQVIDYTITSNEFLNIKINEEYIVDKIDEKFDNFQSVKSVLENENIKNRYNVNDIIIQNSDEIHSSEVDNFIFNDYYDLIKKYDKLYTVAFINEIFNDNTEFINKICKLLNKPHIPDVHYNIMTFLYDEFEFDIELIYVVYKISIMIYNNPNVKSVYEISKQLKIKNIDDIPSFIKGMDIKNAFYYELSNFMGLNLSKPYMELFNEMIAKYDFEKDILLEAIRKASRSNYNIQYIRKILDDWNKENIKTIEDIKQYDLQRREKYNNKFINNKVQKNTSFFDFSRRNDEELNIDNDLTTDIFSRD